MSSRAFLTVQGLGRFNGQKEKIKNAEAKEKRWRRRRDKKKNFSEALPKPGLYPKSGAGRG